MSEVLNYWNDVKKFHYNIKKQNKEHSSKEAKLNLDIAILKSLIDRVESYPDVYSSEICVRLDDEKYLHRKEKAKINDLICNKYKDLALWAADKKLLQIQENIIEAAKKRDVVSVERFNNDLTTIKAIQKSLQLKDSLDFYDPIYTLLSNNVIKNNIVKTIRIELKEMEEQVLKLQKPLYESNEQLDYLINIYDNLEKKEYKFIEENVLKSWHVIEPNAYNTGVFVLNKERFKEDLKDELETTILKELKSYNLDLSIGIFFNE